MPRLRLLLLLGVLAGLFAVLNDLPQTLLVLLSSGDPGDDEDDAEALDLAAIAALEEEELALAMVVTPAPVAMSSSTTGTSATTGSSSPGGNSSSASGAATRPQLADDGSQPPLEDSATAARGREPLDTPSAATLARSTLPPKDPPERIPPQQQQGGTGSTDEVSTAMTATRTLPLPIMTVAAATNGQREPEATTTTTTRAAKASRLLEPLLSARHMWGSGFGANLGKVPVNGSSYLTWTQAAEELFKQRWREVQFPTEGCKNSAAQTGYVEAQVDMEWGITSAMRDIGNQLLYGFLKRRVVVFTLRVVNGPVAKSAMAHFAGCKGERSWIEGCYFPGLTGCTEDQVRGYLRGTKKEVLFRRVPKLEDDYDWFLEHSQPLWEELLRIGAVVRVGRLDPVSTQDFEMAERLALFRTLLLRVAFRPGPALQRAVTSVERRTALPRLAAQGPVVVAHIRRTDKAIDFKSGVTGITNVDLFKNSEEGSVIASLATMSKVLLPWLDRTVGPIATVFVISDDYRIFKPEGQAMLRGGLRGANLTFDSESAQFTPHNGELLKQGHEYWGHRHERNHQMLAEAIVAAKWASYVVGCGSSGVTQLILQLMAGRLRVDPNVLGVFEDDLLVVEDIGRQQQEWHLQQKQQ